MLGRGQRPATKAEFGGRVVVRGSGVGVGSAAYAETKSFVAK